MSKKRLAIIFQRVSRLLRLFILVAKLRKLSSFRRSSKRSLKLLKNHDYGFHGEYQFSPTNTPLIHFRRRKNMRRPRDIYYSLFFLCKCWGKGNNDSFRVEGGDMYGGDFAMEALPAPFECDNAVALLEPLDFGDDDDDDEDEASIDLRAQMFIERFYEDMRMQRQESL